MVAISDIVSEFAHSPLAKAAKVFSCLQPMQNEAQLNCLYNGFSDIYRLLTKYCRNVYAPLMLDVAAFILTVSDFSFHFYAE